MYETHLGDCLPILKTFTSDSIDLIVTDPPYGLSYKSGRQVLDRIKSVKENQSVKIRQSYFDQIHNDDECNFEWLPEAYRILKNNSAIYVFCHWSKWGPLHCFAEKVGFQVRNMIVLEKNNHGMGNLAGAFAGKHELLMYAVKGKHHLNFPNGREKDVWHVPVMFSGSHRNHPNEKPLSWMLPAIVNSSNIGDYVLDPFMGSGSTGVAAIQSGRKFIGIEKIKSYLNISIGRLEAAKSLKKTNIL